MSKKPHFRTTLDSQHAKGSQTLLEDERQHFYHIFRSVWGKLSWKISLLVICEILGLFVNTLTADDNCFFRKGEICCNEFKRNYLKYKKSSQFFAAFKHFETKMTVATYVFPKLQTAKEVVRPMCEKRRFVTSFDSQHVKRSQTLVKIGWQHFYHIFS